MTCTKNERTKEEAYVCVRYDTNLKMLSLGKDEGNKQMEVYKKRGGIKGKRYNSK